MMIFINDVSESPAGTPTIHMKAVKKVLIPALTASNLHSSAHISAPCPYKGTTKARSNPKGSGRAEGREWGRAT